MREWTPSARSRCRTWLRTVSVVTWSSPAICVVEWPRSRRRSTSACRGVRGGGALEEAQHLGLPRCEVRVDGALLLFVDMDELAEDADDLAAGVERHRAD